MSQAAIISKDSITLTIFYIKAKVTKFDLAEKIGISQHRGVIIWTNYDGQESLMLHSMFRGNR